MDYKILDEEIKTIGREIVRYAPRLGLDTEKLLYLNQDIMKDFKPRFTQGIYLFTETEYNELSSFIAARELIERDAAAEVFIANAGGKGSPGFAHWAERLGKSIGPGRVRPLHIPLPPQTKDSWVNTYSESEALINFALKEERKIWYIVAPPFHLLRAFMTAASSSIRKGSEISFYAYPGAPQKWDEFVTHSQGTVKDTRRNLIGKELEGIKKYARVGHIEPPQNIMYYMNKRKTSL
mgnify:CR=1